MDEDEYKIFREAFTFLKTHDTPPATDDDATVDKWFGAVTNDGAALCMKWHEHSLMVELTAAIISHLEKKWKEGLKHDK